MDSAFAVCDGLAGSCGFSPPLLLPLCQQKESAQKRPLHSFQWPAVREGESEQPPPPPQGGGKIGGDEVGASKVNLKIDPASEACRFPLKMGHSRWVTQQGNHQEVSFSCCFFFNGLSEGNKQTDTLTELTTISTSYVIYGNGFHCLTSYPHRQKV